MTIEIIQNRVVADALLGNGSENIINTLSGLTLGRKYFFNWHAHMAHSSTARSLMRFRLDGVNQPNFDGSFRGGINGVFGESILWYGQTVATPASVTSVNWGGESFNDVNSLTDESSIMAIALDELVENTDYFFIEDAITKASIDNTFANNVGASLTFTPDGVSDYAIFAMGTTNNPTTSTSRSVVAMQLFDVVAAAQLTQDGRDTYTPSLETNLIYTQNGMRVLPAPAAIPQTIQCRFIGNGDWDYKYSNIFILRLNTFQNYEFDQNITNGTVGGTALVSIDSITWPVTSGFQAVFGNMAVDTVDVDDEWGSVIRDDGNTLVDWSGSLKDFAASNASPGGAGQPQQNLLIHDRESIGSGSVVSQFFQQVVDDGTKTIRESCLLVIGQVSAAEFEPPVVSNEDPIPGGIDVSLNSNIALRIASSPVAGVDSGTIDISVDVGAGLVPATIGGIFQAGFDGPQSAIVPIVDGSGFDVVVDVVVPFPTNQLVAVRADADNAAQGVSMVQVNYSFTTSLFAFTYSFRTETFKFVDPEVFTEELDMTSLPTGFSPQTSGAGTPPTFDSDGMTTFPNGDTSFIRRNAAGLDFDQGVLIDMEVFGTGTDTQVLQLCRFDQGLVGVNVNFQTGEIYLSDIVNTPPPGFRPGVKNDIIGEIGVSFRLTIKGSASGLIARLYSSTIDPIEPTLLSQTGGPSSFIDVATDFINIGSIGGDAPSQVRVPVVNILNLEDPDEFYPFPDITDSFPSNDILDGGKTLRLRFGTEIDLGAGTELLFIDETFRDESSGAGSSSVSFGVLTLGLSGIGESAVRFMRSYSGDLPSGADVFVDVAVDAAVASNPPQNEVVLAAMQFLSGGDTITAEYVADIRLGTFFRIIRTSGGLQTLKTTVLQSTKTSFQFRFLRAGNQLRIFVDGTSLISTNFKDGVGIIRLLNKTDDNISFNTLISNFNVRPVVTIGDSIVNV